MFKVPLSVDFHVLQLFAESNCQRSYLFCILLIGAPFKSSPSEPSFAIRNTMLLFATWRLYGPASWLFKTLSSIFIQVWWSSRDCRAVWKHNHACGKHCEYTLTLHCEYTYRTDIYNKRYLHNPRSERAFADQVFATARTSRPQPQQQQPQLHLPWVRMMFSKPVFTNSCFFFTPVLVLVLVLVLGWE